MPAPIEFVESEAKSVLNRVEGMPFKWSINPYRGCSHACAFCLDGDTPILMGDGTARLLDEVRIGDQGAIVIRLLSSTGTEAPSLEQSAEIVL